MRFVLVFVLIGCAKGQDYLTVSYSLINSTCNMPTTTVTFEGKQLFEQDTAMTMTLKQSRLSFQRCEYTGTSIVHIDGNALKTNYLDTKDNGDCSGMPLVWEETYTFTIQDDMLTLSSNNCTISFQEK